MIPTSTLNPRIETGRNELKEREPKLKAVVRYESVMARSGFSPSWKLNTM